MIINKPTKAFVLASISVLILGIVSFCFGLLNANMELNEKGYYLAILLLGLFSFVSLQKTVRDKIEGLPISKPYTMMCWFAAASAIALMAIGLFNADLALSEKGFYAMTFILSGFAAITVQKNVRDNMAAKEFEEEPVSEEIPVNE